LGVLVLTAVCLALGMFWHYPGLVAAGAGLGLITVLDATSLALTGGLLARRTVEPLEVPRYGRCDARLEVDHTRRWFAVRAEGVEHVDGDPVEVALGRVDAGLGLRATVPVPTTRRGRVTVGPLLVRSYGLAGLSVRPRWTDGQSLVRVLPRVLPVRAVPPGARRGHVDAEERVIRGGTDILGLHEYVPGDDLRRVHWGTSARTGMLMVREDADPAQAHLAVILDDRARSYLDRDAFEEAVDVAASLVHDGQAEGHPVRLRTIRGGLDLELSGPGTPAQVAALADISLVDSDDAAAGPLFAPGDLDVVAVVTGAAADAAALALAASRAEVGAVLAVGLSDPDALRIEESTPGARPPSGRVAVLHAARAEDLLAAWDRTVASRVVTS
jgi:uncharacterized protein (DUF58 family)